MAKPRGEVIVDCEAGGEVEIELGGNVEMNADLQGDAGLEAG